ncbi:hypothetical protein MTO96_033402 [Rhipicephalus appendiculatus]
MRLTTPLTLVVGLEDAGDRRFFRIVVLRPQGTLAGGGFSTVLSSPFTSMLSSAGEDFLQHGFFGENELDPGVFGGMKSSLLSG